MRAPLSKTNVSEAREKAVANARLLKRLEEKETELEKIRYNKVKLQIREEKEKDKIERISEAIETGDPSVANMPRTRPNEIALSKDVLKQLFEERCDAFARYYFSPRSQENYDGIIREKNSELH
jgi:anti-sigma28 factor (negative regulator of flagellin synthesis)